MNKIKMLIACIATVFSGNAMAQKVTVADMEIAPGSTADLVISLEDNNIVPASAQLYVTLPEGISIDKPKKDFAEGEILDADNVNVNITKQSDGTYLVVIYHDKGYEFKAAAGTLLKLTLTAAADIATGNYQVSIAKIKFATQANTALDCADVTGKVTVSNTTGIKGISVEQLEKGEVYDLSGKKVSAVKKGVYVVNGKKVTIK